MKYKKGQKVKNEAKIRTDSQRPNYVRAMMTNAVYVP